MQRSLVPAVRVTGTVLAPTLLVHGLLLLLLVQEERIERSSRLTPWPTMNVWIHLPAGPPRMEARPELDLGEERSLYIRVVPISIIFPAIEPQIPSETPPVGDGPRVDWHEQARALASRASQNPEPLGGRGTPQKQRRPCEPRESSFVWSPVEERRGWLPLPYLALGERCGIGLGFFGCSLGELPEPEKHLFGDMKKGGTPPSSVPHPDTCD